MSGKSLSYCGTLLCLCALVPACASQDSWSQWGRTNSRNMVSPTKDIKVDFFAGRFVNQESDDIDLKTVRGAKWVIPLGSQSYSTPIVADGKIYVGTNNANARYQRFKDDRSLLLCLDEQTGELLWQLTVPKIAGGEEAGDWEELGITASPIIEGNRAYIVTSRGEVLCLDTRGMANGNDGPFKQEGRYMTGQKPLKTTDKDADIIWRFDMRDPSGIGATPDRTPYSHPMIRGPYLYINTSNGIDRKAGAKDKPGVAALIVLDKKTGKLLAKDEAGISDKIMRGNWSSPSFGSVNADKSGQRELVFFGGSDGFVYAFNAEPVNGVLKVAWRTDCNPKFYRDDPELIKPVMATPVFHQGKVYASIGQDPENEIQRGNLLCMEAATGKVIWRFSIMNTAMATVAVADQRVYISDSYGYIYGLDTETGVPYWRHDSLGHCWGSPLWVDGKLIQGNNDGVLTVFDLGKMDRLAKQNIGQRGAPLFTRANRPKTALITNVKGFPLAKAESLKGVITEIKMPGSLYGSPVVANGVLFINAFRYLYAIPVQRP
jgi:outer membrane protein assembly factor BamB